MDDCLDIPGCVVKWYENSVHVQLGIAQDEVTVRKH